MKLSTVRTVVLGSFLLLSSVGCHRKPPYVWQCIGPSADKPDPHGACSCILHDASEGSAETRCVQEYECCVQSSESMDSETRTTCNCWNPSQGGPTCESKIPRPGQESFLW